jgi:hypothetical protein
MGVNCDSKAVTLVTTPGEKPPMMEEVHRQRFPVSRHDTRGFVAVQSTPTLI